MTVGSRDPRLAWARYEVARSALTALAASAGRAGVDILAVKGVVTSTLLYGDRSERPLTDLDVRIRPRDFRRVLRLTREQRWRLATHHWSYLSADIELGGIMVDVEATIGPPGILALSVDDMLRRARRDPDGFFVPEVHDHAVLLTVNAFKDRLPLAQPWSVEDLRRIVVAPGFEVRTYVERLRDARATSLGWIVADWLTARRESEAWRSIRELLGGEAPLRPRYAKLVRRLLDRASSDDPSLLLRLLVRAASDAPLRRPAALMAAGAWELESRWRSRGQSA
jgi:hypothetical protein